MSAVAQSDNELEKVVWDKKSKRWLKLSNGARGVVLTTKWIYMLYNNRKDRNKCLQIIRKSSSAISSKRKGITSREKVFRTINFKTGQTKLHTINVNYASIEPIVIKMNFLDAFDFMCWSRTNIRENDGRSRVYTDSHLFNCTSVIVRLIKSVTQVFIKMSKKLKLHPHFLGKVVAISYKCKSVGEDGFYTIYPSLDLQPIEQFDNVTKEHDVFLCFHLHESLMRSHPIYRNELGRCECKRQNECKDDAAARWNCSKNSRHFEKDDE